MSNSVKIFLMAVLFLGISFSVFAQEIPEVLADEEVKPEDLEIGKPRLLPGSPFYFLKNWWRGIRMFLAFRPERKAKLRLKFANEKIIELEKLVEAKKDPRIIERSLEDFQKEMTELKKARVKNLKKFSEKLMDHQLLHQRILERLEKEVPPEILEKVKENRERHLERFATVMQKVEEKFPEKLAEILERQKGSKFKQFKELEKLIEIEEKVPEGVKEKIEEERGKILEKFHEKLEKMPEEERGKFKDYVEEIGGDKLKHLKILRNLRGEETSERLEKMIRESEERKLSKIEKWKVTSEEAAEQIKKAEGEITKAKEVVKKIDSRVYKGKFALPLLEKAKKAFEKGKYGKAYGLAFSAYRKAQTVREITEELGKIKHWEERSKEWEEYLKEWKEYPKELREELKEWKENPEKWQYPKKWEEYPKKWRERFEEWQEKYEEWQEKYKELYPGISLPSNWVRCLLLSPPRCPKGKVIIERTPEDCPVVKCIGKPEIPPAPEGSLCFTIWDPICGKDGKTYSNECFARIAGVEIDHEGFCKEKPIERKRRKIECKFLWAFYTSGEHRCRRRRFCGAYMSKELRTFDTKEECEAALRATEMPQEMIPEEAE